ncbi:MAG TPA: hypothetical protein VK550_23470 [Polyangiaceae bacterium]|nr:hypothetical protein [Polyangiaceae bacterium]
MRCSGLWVVAIAVTGLFGCKTRQASVDQARAAPKAAEPTEEELEHMAIPASERAAMRQRLVTVLSKHPEAYLTLRGETPSLDMRPRVAKPVSFRLALPGIERWSDANVGRFDVRIDDRQESIDTSKVDAKRGLSYTFSESGPVMFLFCAGPKVDPPVGALWEKVTHCTKTIVEVSDAQNRTRDTTVNVTHETALPFEVTPMIAPRDLRVGFELGVIFAYRFAELEHFPVAALRPDGSIDHQTTGEGGLAHFQISQAGHWVIRYVKSEADGERVGELVFEVSESK